MVPEMTASVWGDFEVYFDRIVGRGGTSTVYEARQISLDRPCVVKVLDSAQREPEHCEEMLARFRNEAKLLARVRDPRIVQVYQAGENDGRLWFAMEKVDGQTLEKAISAGPPMTEAEAVRIAREIALGLRSAYVQEQMIHRDIKPGNVFLTRSGEVRIADFGLAKVLSGRPLSLTATGTVMGTPTYLAPEIIEGKPADHRADLYALGCLMYESLLQLPPFEGENFVDIFYKHVHEPPSDPRELRPDLSERVSQVILRCLKKSPEERFAGYDEFLQALDEPQRPRELPPPSGRKRILWTSAGAAALAAVAWAGLGLFSSEPLPAPTPPAAPPVAKEKISIPAPVPLPRWWDLIAQGRFSEALKEMGEPKFARVRASLHAALGNLEGAAAAAREAGEDDHPYSLVERRRREIRGLHPIDAPNLFEMERRIDELQLWGEREDWDAASKAFCWLAAAEGMERIGADGASARSRAAALLASISGSPAPRSLDDAAAAEWASRMRQEGKLEEVRRLFALARRFALTPLMEGLAPMERELHAGELAAMGNDADVLQNFRGTAAHRALTARVLADFKSRARKNWLADRDAWKRKGADLGRSSFDFEEGRLTVRSPVAAYAQCPAPNSEGGYHVEMEAALDPRGWAAVVLQADPEILLSFADGAAEIRAGREVRARVDCPEPLEIDVVVHRDHLLVFVRGEAAAIFGPGEIVVDSVVRLGVCRGTLTIKSVEVPE